MSVSRPGYGLLLLLLGWLHPVAATTLTVAAAISLREALEAVAGDYERLYPGEQVSLELAATGTLLQQIRAGAPVDLFLSADEASMDAAAAAQLIVRSTREDFAGNTLALIVPAQAAPGEGSELLSQPGVRLAIGDEKSVPAGRYAQAFLRQKGLWPALQDRLIRGENVRQVLDDVARAEVDAGLVYATDVRIAAGRVRLLRTYPLQPPIRYPLAQIADSPHAAQAAAFVRLLRGSRGRAQLRRLGFILPGDPAWSP